jgi:hypothetical protein
MNDYLLMSEASRRLGLCPRAISDGITRGAIDPSNWPLLCGRRVVPLSELENIRRALSTDRRKCRRRRKAETEAVGA